MTNRQAAKNAKILVRFLLETLAFLALLAVLLSSNTEIGHYAAHAVVENKLPNLLSYNFVSCSRSAS
jgi:hypothetical protein